MVVEAITCVGGIIPIPFAGDGPGGIDDCVPADAGATSTRDQADHSQPVREHIGKVG